MRWRDAPPTYGPQETIYNRFIRWSRLGVFNRIFATTKASEELPRRWVVERTHPWLGLTRRRAKDIKQTIASANEWLFIASTQLFTRRIAKA